MFISWIAIGLCLGVVFLLSSRSYYTAYTTLLLEDRTIRPFPEASGNFEAADTAYADSQVQVLRSREVIGRVVDEYNLTEDGEFGRPARGIRASLAESLPFLRPVLLGRDADSTKEELQYITIFRVSSALSVQRLGISNAVEISFTSRDPHRAAAIANAVSKAYIDTRLEWKQRAREDAAAQLRERLAEAREKAFNSEPAAQEKPFKSSETGEQARERFREVQNTMETYRVLYNSFLQRYTEAVQQLSVPGARVITPAEPPLRRSWPIPVLVLALAAFGGAAGGFAHSLVRQVTDQTLHSCNDLRRIAGLRCLTEIRLVKRSNWKKVHYDPNGLQESYLRKAAEFDGAISKAAVYLQAMRINSSGSAIGVAAIDEGGGGSSIAIHLARVFAQSGQKTLLIDANWRAPDPYGDLEPASPQNKFYERIVSVEIDPGILDVLSIRGGSDVSELSASQAIASALLRTQVHYSCIIVDFHAFEHSVDVVASIPMLDEMILVVEARRTAIESLWDALRFLSREKVSIILNKVGAS